MELKVFKDTIASYGGRWETRLELPVETELLIPDYLPAVFKIVKCLITPVVLQNRVTGNRWQTEGYLRCTVYYQSEEPGARLLRTEQKFAFEKSVELPAGQYAEGPVRAAWAEVIEGVLRHYEAVEPLCAQLLRLRYLEGKTEDEVVPALYVSRSTYYRKELEVLSTVAVEAARRGLL